MTLFIFGLMPKRAGWSSAVLSVMAENITDALRAVRIELENSDWQLDPRYPAPDVKELGPLQCHIEEFHP